MQEKLQQLQAKLAGHEEAKRDLEKSMAEKSDLESEEKEKLLKVTAKLVLPDAVYFLLLEIRFQELLLINLIIT